MGQESRKGSAEHLTLGVLVGVQSDTFWGCHHLGLQHVQDGSLTELAPGVCPRLAASSAGAGDRSAHLHHGRIRELGFFQNERPGRTRQKLHGLFVPGLGNHKSSLPLLSTVISESLMPAQINGEGT